MSANFFGFWRNSSADRGIAPERWTPLTHFRPHAEPWPIAPNENFWRRPCAFVRYELELSGVVRHGALGNVPPCSLRMHANFAAVQTMAVLIFLPSSVSSKLDRQSHQLLWQTVAKIFSHIHFYRPNARWLSILDDFVTTNFGTRVPHAHAPLEQNSGDATAWARYSDDMLYQNEIIG